MHGRQDTEANIMTVNLWSDSVNLGEMKTCWKPTIHETCPMTRKKHQRSFLMNREDDRIEYQVYNIYTEIQNASPAMEVG